MTCIHTNFLTTMLLNALRGRFHLSSSVESDWTKYLTMTMNKQILSFIKLGEKKKKEKSLASNCSHTWKQNNAHHNMGLAWLE